MRTSENSNHAFFSAGAEERSGAVLRGLAALRRTEYTSPSFEPPSLSKVA